MSTEPVFDPAPLVAQELSLPLAGVTAVIALLREGATVPFIARYRKEATGGLDELQIRNIDERRTYLTELHDRREAILKEIGSQGKLTDGLKAQINACTTKAELEDIYLPFKPKRRTRATIAKERGLEPLAELMWSRAPTANLTDSAKPFVDPAKEVPDTAAALAGARDICAERIAERADFRKQVREALSTQGSLRVSKHKDHEDKVTKFDMYASFEEPIATMPSHRFLAIRRGEAESILKIAFELDGEPQVLAMQKSLGAADPSPFAGELRTAIDDAYKRLLFTGAQVDQRVELKMRSDRSAVDVFAQNLEELLLAAPYGTKTVLGIDPGQRTGCKCAVVDATGKLLAHEVIYLVQGGHAQEKARAVLRDLCSRFDVRAIAVGNGTHGRETEQFAREVLAGEGLKEVLCVPVSEAGASVYSASDVAREEFPELDLTVRGAISIARRLQDPLAELVKVDPKSIGVGQYQHDVYQPLLAKKLDEVIESCVNRVGVELNTASAPLLARVAGIGATAAQKIVAHRNEKGRFKSRAELLKVPGIGPRTFEQAAGFLRIAGGEHPLDASAVHPERYDVVVRMAQDLGVEMQALIGNREALSKVKKERYFAEGVGEFTLDDILAELAKPGRDPRASFEPPKFRDDVRSLEDLKIGMELEGVVTNVTAFGAFVDVGVHQDGLVHVSKLADKFVKDPNEVVKVGAKIRVRVLEVDLERKRISLSAKKEDARPVQGQGQPAAQKSGPSGKGGQPGRQTSPQKGSAPQKGGAPQKETFANNPFASLLRK